MINGADPSHGRTDPSIPCFSTHPFDPAATAGSWADVPAPKLLELTVQYPTAGICVVAVDGELDALTAPTLKTCVSEQVAALPAHLVLDLESVRFMGAQGLSCLLHAHTLVQQGESQLHLAGLATRAVARPLDVTGLLALFSTYHTLSQALAVLVE